MKKEFLPEELNDIMDRIANKEITLTAAARELGVTRPLLTRRIENHIRDCIVSSELVDKYRLAIKSNQTGKSLEETKKYNPNPLNAEELDAAKSFILSGRYTLSKLAQYFGRTRDYLKKSILESIVSESEREEFLASIGDASVGTELDEFLAIDSLEDKKAIIFQRLNDRRKKLGKSLYKEQLLEKKYARLIKYFTETRNDTLPDDVEKLTEDDVLAMVFETPTLLSASLSDRIIPAITNLDSKQSIGLAATNEIIKEDSSILLSSISRTNLQIRLLEDYGLLDSFMRKPRNFRTSPELIYALAEFSIESDRTNAKDIMLSRNKLLERYGVTQESLKEIFNIKNSKYADDEYFEK